jgi:ribosomal protein S18 acetylase RimI-like enzyme
VTRGTSKSSDTNKAGSALFWRETVTLADVGVIRALVAETGMFMPGETDIAVELVSERLEKGSASGYEFVLAEVDREVAGYACYGQTPATEGTFDLYWIVVRKRFQGLGIGRAILERAELEARSKGAKRLYVDTSGQEQYKKTREFYEKAGFRKVAELPDFYRDRDSKVIYVKFI